MNDVEIYKEWQAKPSVFIEDIWDLKPQPLKKENKNKAQYYIDRGQFNKVKAEWFEDFIKGEHITWQQWLIVLAVERALAGKGVNRISIASGHGIGKSAILAMLILWYMFCHKDAQVPCTAPTSEQMYDVLWKELSIWLSRMPEEIQNLYDHQSSYLRIKENPDAWFARARTARKENPEALSGIHADYVFAVADEASGVYEEIFNTAEGALTGPNVLFIMISNPTALQGYFFDSHHDDSHNWQTFSFSSEESPIVDWEFVERIREKHGINSDEYRIRVMGKFPLQNAALEGWTQLLTRQDIGLALCREEEVRMEGARLLGVDVSEGNGGDDSVLVVRGMNAARIELADPNIDTMQLAGRIVERVTRDGDAINPLNVSIDGVGIGDGVIKRCHEQKLPVTGVKAQEKAFDPKRYKNKKAEGYWKTRELVKGGMKLILDTPEEPHKSKWYQLTTIYYRTNSSGKLEIMPKTMMKKHGMDSPDVAEALMHTCIIPIHTPVDNAEDVFFRKKMNEKKRKKHQKALQAFGRK